MRGHDVKIAIDDGLADLGAGRRVARAFESLRETAARSELDSAVRLALIRTAGENHSGEMRGQSFAKLGRHVLNCHYCRARVIEIARRWIMLGRQ